MTSTSSGRQRQDLPVGAASATASAPEVPVIFRTDAGSASPRNLTLGYVFALLGALAFSSKAIFIKLAYAEGMGVEALLALRMMVALPVYLAIGLLSLRDRRRRGDGLPATHLFVKAVAVGALGYWVAMYLDFASLSLIPAQLNVLILMTYPIFVVIFGALIFRFPVQVRAIVAFAVAYVGLAVIYSGRFGSADGEMILGAGFVLAAAVAFALYMLFAKEVIGRMGARLFTCVTMVAVSILAIGQFLIVDTGLAPSVTPAAWLYTILLAVVATIFPTFLLNAALQRISAQANATIGMLAPVTTILLAVVVLGEMLSARDLVGAALVIGGVGWFTLGTRK